MSLTEQRREQDAITSAQLKALDKQRLIESRVR